LHQMPSKATVVVADVPEQVPTAPVEGKITTVYWNMCGLGQVPRYALEIAGVEYVDVRVEAGEAGTPDYKQVWQQRKDSMNGTTTFPNLPYLLDGDVGLSQSGAILRYIGRKFNLMEDASTVHLVDLVLEQMADFDKESTVLSYNSVDGLKNYCVNTLPGRLKSWSSLIGEKPFLTGDVVTVADLKFYETMRKLKLIEAHPEVNTETIKSFPTLEAFVDRVEALPAIQAYQASAAFMARPLNNPHAKFR